MIVRYNVYRYITSLPFKATHPVRTLTRVASGLDYETALRVVPRDTAGDYYIKKADPIR